MPRIERKNFSKIFIDYTVAVGAAAAAFGLTIFLWNYIEPQATPLFLAAVAVAAWRGGIYPGLLTAILSALALDYFFNPPLNAFELSAKNIVGAHVFLLVALLISFIDRARKRAFAESERFLINEQTARRAAEEANRHKDVFLAMVTHELRAPLNTILGWTNLLGKGTLDEEKTRHAINVIERGARTQARLVEDLLDISRIRTGKFHINASPIELCAVIEAAIESVAPAIAAKRIRLHRDLDRGVGAVSGDAERLQQVVFNLLSNAVKFTREDAVKFTREEGQIKIRLERDGTRAAENLRRRRGHSPRFPAIRIRFVSPIGRNRQGETQRSRFGSGNRPPFG